MADPQQNPQTNGTTGGQGTPVPPPSQNDGQNPQSQQAGGQGTQATQGNQQMPPPVQQPVQMPQQPGMMPPQGMYYPGYPMQPQQGMPMGMPQQSGMMPPQAGMPGMYPQMPQQPYAPMYAPPGYPQGGMGMGAQQGMMGMGGGNPPAGNPFGDAGNTAAGQQKLSNFHFGEWQKKFTTTIRIQSHNLQFDEAYFLKLLAGSISLTRDEKKRIIESIPKLRQQQIDELIRIFEEEKAKFIELSPKHGEQLEKLEKKHREDWRDLETMMVQQNKKQEDTAKADEIRKKLGLA